MHTKQTISKSIPLELERKIQKQVLYAAAFICPGIQSVSLKAGMVHFELMHPVADDILQDGLKTLVKRFSKAQEFDSETLFSRPKTGSGRGIYEIEALIKADIMHQTHQGIFLWREPLSLFLRFLDDILVQRFARAFNAQEEIFPHVIAIDKLAKTNHLSSFPEHLNFVVNLRSDLNRLDEFSDKAKTTDDLAIVTSDFMASSCLLHNPSTCYHCYSSRQGQMIDSDMVVTAIASCHRYEGANHNELGRLMEFNLREVIFLGSPDFVRQTRADSLELVKSFADDWQIGGVLQTENDPFFTSDFEVKANHQRRMKMKYEYCALLGDADDGLAILSSNLHGTTFSKTFNIKGNGFPVHTGCLGFGLERLAIALIAQHGIVPEAWPEKMKSEWGCWRARI